MTLAAAQGKSETNPRLLLAEKGFVPAAISGLRKAAILMVAVGDEVAKMLFQSLSERDVQRVVDEITRMGDVSSEQSQQVLTEFYGLLETQQYVVRGGEEYARRLLTDAFGPQRAEQLLEQVRKIRERSIGDLAMLQEMEPQQLSKFLEEEHPQAVALVLAHLDVKKGTAVLMSLPEAVRVDAVKRMAEMRHFSPEMAQKVARVLHKRMDGTGRKRSSYSGFKAVADLMNGMATETSKGILEKIEQDKPQLAIGIRDLMFTFEDFLTVPGTSIRELVSSADKKILATALKGARDNIKAHLLKEMSSRAADMLKEDMEMMGPIRGKDVNAAQQELLQLARKLEDEGKMILRMEADGDLSD
jgi:flagellar motor switch protein FliG